MPLLTAFESTKLGTLLIHLRINHMNRAELFARLQKSHDDQIVGVEELAVQLNTTARVVYKIHSTSPEKLPPRLIVFGRKLCWRLGTCREWIRALEAVQHGSDVAGMDSELRQRKPMGRPRMKR
jgi:hypothetical protein